MVMLPVLKIPPPIWAKLFEIVEFVTVNVAIFAFLTPPPVTAPFVPRLALPPAVLLETVEPTSERVPTFNMPPPPTSKFAAVLFDTTTFVSVRWPKL